MDADVLEFARKLAEGARAKALEDRRRLEAIRAARAIAENSQGLKPPRLQFPARLTPCPDTNRFKPIGYR